MADVRIVTLYSGSGGNSTYISVGDTAILIDAGKSARTLCSRLVEIGSDIKNIKAIFITHEHTDHISALETICKKNSIPIHITEQSATRFDRCPDSAVHKCLVRHTPIFTEQVGGLKISSFRTPHDSKMSVGYRIEFELCGELHAVGVATDIGYVSDSVRDGLCGCKAVVIEANHDREMVRCGCYPAALKRRILSGGGHLSNDDCAEISGALARQGTKRIHLMHLSRENNTPDRALDAVRGATDPYGVKVTVSSPDCPTFLE
jgi:phosphoribosyl 1,2-cyclic phosphodiesterase